MANNKEKSVQFMYATGLIPVELNDKDKSPSKGYSLLELGRLDKQGMINKFSSNPSANMGALFAGRYVDVDIDSFEPSLQSALDALLPPCGHIWGRPGKRRSHRVYQLEQNDDFDRSLFARPLRIIKEQTVVNGVSYSVEVRGGKTSEGMYTVLPGSFIDLGPEANRAKGYAEQGEEIQWEDGVDSSASSTITRPEVLLKRIRMAQVCAMVAPHWVPGRRNNLSLALAGLWWRISALTLSIMAAGEIMREDFPEMMVIDLEDAELMMETLCTISEDDDNDRRSRMLNLKNTWKKLDKDHDAKVTGGKSVAETIGEGGDEVVQCMYRLLSDSPKMEEVEKWVEKMVLHYGKGTVIDLDLVRDGEAMPMMTRFEAQNTFGRETIEVFGRKIALVDFIYTSKMIRYVYGLTLNPADLNLVTEQKGKLWVNQWRGFDVQPHPEPVDTEYMAPLIGYVYNILANGDQALGDWIMYWVAHIFQTPAEKSKTALVLIGDYGAGKTFLSEHIIAPLIGNYHSYSVQNVEDLTGRFNMVMDNKFFIAANEAIHKNRYVSAQALKAFITDDTISIEPKNVNAYQKPNFTRFLFTSNNEFEAVFIEPSPNERRFTVVRVADTKVGEEHKPYWNNLVEWTRINQPRILRWLLDLKIDMNTIRKPYYTLAKAKLQSNSTTVELNWMIDRLIEGFPLSREAHTQWYQAYHAMKITKKDKDTNLLVRTEWPDKFLWEALEDDFRQYFRKWAKTSYRANARLSLKTMFPYDPPMSHQTDIKSRSLDGSLQTKRIRLYTMPGRDEIIKHLKAKFGAGLMEELLANTDGSKLEVEDSVMKEEKF